MEKKNKKKEIFRETVALTGKDKIAAIDEANMSKNKDKRDKK